MNRRIKKTRVSEARRNRAVRNVRAELRRLGENPYRFEYVPTLKPGTGSVVVEVWRNGKASLYRYTEAS